MDDTGLLVIGVKLRYKETSIDCKMRTSRDFVSFRGRLMELLLEKHLVLPSGLVLQRRLVKELFDDWVELASDDIPGLEEGVELRFVDPPKNSFCVVM